MLGAMNTNLVNIWTRSSLNHGTSEEILEAIKGNVPDEV